MAADSLRQPTVWFPSNLEALLARGDLQGYFHADTNHYVVVSSDLSGVRSLVSSPDIPPLHASRATSGSDWTFTADGRPCLAKPYALEQDLFSRHSGILEPSQMQQSSVIFCGCGSVGSLAALELARSGVGRFLLIDADVLAIENLCRHQCGLADVGRTKVAAVADRIRQINPDAEIQSQATTIEQMDPALIRAFGTGSTLMLACADSRRADRHAARLAASLGMAFLSIGLWERAFAGEIFYSHPDAPMPCYGCAFEGLAGELSRRPEPQRRFYTTEADLSQLSFQPAISIDIAHVTQIGLKLAIDLLNRHTSGYVPRLLGHLSQYTLVCNSNDPRLGGEAAEIFSHPLQVTTSIQPSYGRGCPPCRWSH
jgi:molybdopterin/thiamine biosynthesis adenylyltransferase